MKTIENKETSIKETAEASSKNLTYCELLKLIMNVPPKEGYTISEMKMRLDIYAALVPSEKNEMSLEDAPFEIVKQSVNNFRWALVHKDVVDFVDYINSL